ncbi:MAG: hypothetical protein WKF88_05280 [Ferruginibacter sp.]
MKLTSVLSLLFSFCILSSCAQPGNWKGTVIHNFSGSVNNYSFASKTDKVVIPESKEPFAASGDIYFLNDKFNKRGTLIRKFSGGQFKDVLDMSSENSVYKKQLDEYSFIRGTGISGIMSYMDDPKVSPDGKYISVTILGGHQNAFTKNCVAVFSMSTQELITKFDEKYYGSWTPDNRLVICGTYKRGSTDEPLYESKSPGIFITDKNLSNPVRVDPGLNDPSPYHATVSPDGGKIAYIINNRVWIMDITGKNNKQLSDVDRDNVETYPAFSPDGKYVACWVYKTFERSYYTAIAVLSVAAPKPVVLSDKAPVWPKDTKGFRISGGNGQMSWIK